jgi:type IV pilus assembly protein PilZ
METMPNNAGANYGILSLTIKELPALHSAYMPFLENGGMFIPSPKNYHMGDDIFILLSLMDEPDRIPLAGTVVWITPANAQSSRAQGIGVQFNDKENPVKQKIETYLSGMLGSSRQTHTL